MKSLIVLILILSLFTQCKKENGDNDINIFTVDDDITLGAQMEAEIAANPTEFPLLNPTTYASSYAYLEAMKNDILNGGNVFYKDKFAWKLHIVVNDTVQNAFCTPGGYIYVYTGLIKYLDTASHLAGVMGHEMAHADRRHSTDQMTQQYGISVLLNIVLGNNAQGIGQLVAGIASLQFSKADETEADTYSVKYLCPTSYRADGAAGFFAKLIADGNNCASAFFSTHPCPDNRVANIESQANQLGCTGNDVLSGMTYAQFKATLP